MFLQVQPLKRGVSLDGILRHHAVEDDCMRPCDGVSVYVASMLEHIWCTHYLTHIIAMYRKYFHAHFRTHGSFQPSLLLSVRYHLDHIVNSAFTSFLSY